MTDTPGTDLANRPTGALGEIDEGSTWWSNRQLAALEHLGVEQASQGDLLVYLHVCQRTGLDPFARQIYMIRRDGKQVIQTGIDGYRLVARRAVDRSGEGLAIGAPEWCGTDGVWRDVWLDETPPSAARVTVTRAGDPFTSVALWREYAQHTGSGTGRRLTRMWETRGAGQLAKCAEALSLRKAFPQDLSGIYTDDELGRRDVVPGAVERSAPVTAAEVLGETVEAPVDGEVVEAEGEYPDVDVAANDPANQGAS